MIGISCPPSPIMPTYFAPRNKGGNKHGGDQKPARSGWPRCGRIESVLLTNIEPTQQRGGGAHQDQKNDLLGELQRLAGINKESERHERHGGEARAPRRRYSEWRLIFSAALGAVSLAGERPADERKFLAYWG